MTNKIKDVDELIKAINHPQEDLIQQMRLIVKETSSELMEGVKWNSPSYSLNGNDIITFNFHYKGYVTLVFHTGPKGKDTHTKVLLFQDDSKQLEWVADKRAVLKIATNAELDLVQEDLRSIIRKWIEKAKTSFQVD